MNTQRIEMALLLPLFLISIGCVSATAVQDSTLDINAVLRELTVQLAENNVGIKQLQRQNEAQAAELVSIKSKANMTEEQVKALRKDREVRQVAFSASLLDSGPEDTGYYFTTTNLIFKTVIENIGNAYNPQTGNFTAPVRGAYHFEFYIHGGGHDSHVSGATLMKNKLIICSAYEFQSRGQYQSSNGATLLLEVGDVVFLRQLHNTRIIEDAELRYNTFSGHLLFTM